jgi:dihydroxy-acid dehydratase
VFSLDSADLIDRVALITEGQVSGLVNRGLVVGEASPEAAEGGPLAFIENGDIIAIDVETKSVELEVAEDVMAKRREQPREFGAKGVRGFLGVYQQTARPVHLGANME